MENSSSVVSTTTPTEPALADYDELVAVLGSQNLPESPTIRIDISKFISSEQHHPIPENVLPDIENQIESTTRSLENPDDDPSNHPPIVTLITTIPRTALFNYMWSLRGVIVNWFYRQNPTAASAISMVNLDSNSSRRVGQNAFSNANASKHAPPPTFPANVLPDTENQIESTATSMGNPENDSTIHPLIATTPHIALLHDYSNPKIATYFLGVYPICIALVSLKFIAAKYSPFETHIPFMIISMFLYLMAILDLKILFWLYDRLKCPSHQHFCPRRYKFLARVFDILWILATLSVVAVLFTPRR